MCLLLITDLDNTLVGDDDATQAFNQQLQAVRSEVRLVYSTGRSLSSTQALVRERQLLTPNYLITGVGTGIYDFTAAVALDQGNLDPTWAERLSQQWDRSAIAGRVGSLPLQPQPETEQNPWKLSYCLDPKANSEAVISELSGVLNQLGFPTQVIFSSGRDVDILPMQANKGNAARYLQELVQVAAGQTLVCGDSGNDISLFEQAELGVIVQNAQPEMLAWHSQYGKPGHYLAKAAYAWGMLEGLRYFQFF